ncbi:MAG TPA: hypothetical protein PLY73_07530, partial [Candidatus Ozemobacteraceae bacterium]|nr:hypothetical protein [Candidatus Ozemobacteraceae bacterium]
KDAFREFSEFVKLECKKRDLPGSAGTSPGEFGEGGFYQGLRRLPGNEGWVWVSSAKRREEVYDLWRLGPGKTAAKGNARAVLENVHPALLVDPDSGTTYIGKYIVNDMRQRRLVLWAVPAKGRPFQVVDEPGSFRPLRVSAGRLWYLSVENGMTRVRSVPVPDVTTPPRAGQRPPSRIEYEFAPSLRPLDVALDVRRGRLLYIQQEGMMRQLMSVGLPDEGSGGRTASERGSSPVVLFANCGIMRYPSVHGDDILFCAETQNRTLQLFRIPAGSSTAVRLTRLPGGVWDYDLMEDGTPLVITLRNGGFRPLVVDLSASLAPLIPEAPTSPRDATCSATPDIALGMFAQGGVSAGVASDDAVFPESLDSRMYTPEYRSSFWLPKMNRDDQGAVFGVYSYRADRLDRNRLEFSPTYGFKSRNWGYAGNYQHRFDLFKVGFAAEDRVVRKSYLSNSYYERIRSQDLSLSYPFSLSTSLTAGVNMTHRGIAEYPDIGDVPTVGRDHSLYAELYHRAIRTEPFWDIFPRRGRVVTASWRRGSNMAGGELIYDSLGIRWNEYVPLGNTGWVATLRGWAAEDDKENDIRRPDDLNLGGTDFLRGYEGSVRFGDSLRAAAFHIGRPIPVEIPWIQSWVHKELVVAEAFWEMGDVRNTGRRYQYLFDHGFEIRGRVLLLRRIPLTFRTGVGWPHDGGEKHSYATVDITTLTGLLQ